MLYFEHSFFNHHAGFNMNSTQPCGSTAPGQPEEADGLGIGSSGDWARDAVRPAQKRCI